MIRLLERNRSESFYVRLTEIFGSVQANWMVNRIKNPNLLLFFLKEERNSNLLFMGLYYFFIMGSVVSFLGF